MAERIVFTAKQQVSCELFTPAEPTGSQIRVRALCSLMSTGTENIVYNQIFEPGTHWHRWVKMPFYPGYALVGVVEALGPEASRFAVGDRVACRAGHATVAVVDEAGCLPVPEGVSDEDASWFALAKIAGMGLAAAELRVGAAVAIIGAGPVGQMMTRWAVQAGADPVVLIDPAADRLALASAGGATHTLAMGAGEALEPLQGICGGELPEVVVDGTGHPVVFNLALKLLRRHGRLVLLGDAGTPSEQRLSSDILFKGLHVVGAHDGHDKPGWDAARIGEVFFNAIRRGRLNLDGMISHRFRATDCAAAYTLANTNRNATMGILFDYR